jgi:hypothetical protein
MRKTRIAACVLAGLLVVGAVRPAQAASFYSLCLQLDNSPFDQYLLNLNVQGNAIMVSGTLNRSVTDDFGPISGSVSLMPSRSTFMMGLTVTYANMGDYSGPNFQHVVFEFFPTGIAYRRSVSGSSSFTQGTAHAFACPAS